MHQPDIEHHPLPPFLPRNAKVLMLGSFPPQPKRWSMEFYYPNFTNDMWRIMGLLFHDNKDHFIIPGKKIFDKEQLIDFLNTTGIAIFDTATSIRRLADNASDKFLEVVTATDIGELLDQIPDCECIMTTGQKATDTLRLQFNVDEPKIGSYSEFVYKDRTIRFYRMPSSSRAYPISVAKKADSYRILFQDINLL